MSSQAFLHNSRVLNCISPAPRISVTYQFIICYGPMGRTSADLFGIVHGKVCFLVEGLLDVMKPCNKKAFGRVKKYFFFS